LRIDFDTGVIAARLPDDAPMLCKRLGVTFGAKLVQEPRRAFDVGKQERDGSAR
jgi:hypothetical protein